MENSQLELYHGMYPDDCYAVSSSSYMEISDSNGMQLEQQKHHQTMMWQQNQYMGDSGIQSSVTTRVSDFFR